MAKKIYAVVGKPVMHSKSPEIYNYLFNKYNIDALYIPVELSPDNIQDFFDRYKEAINLCGANFTMPHKEWAASYAVPSDDTSRLLQSVNTINLESGKGYTTDGKGLILSLSFQGFDVNNKNVVVIGAGGAAKSICHELIQCGVKSLTILNRTKEKATELAAVLGGNATGDGLSCAPDYLNGCDLLINSTSMGMHGQKPMDLSLFENLSPDTFVYDIVYEPRSTALLQLAGNKGCRFCGGIDMLICQALYAFEIFTGNPPHIDDRNELFTLLN